MRLFTINPYKPNIYHKIVYDYLYETDNRINALQNDIDNHNPNWIILNESYNVSEGELATVLRPLFSTETLVSSGLIRIALSSINELVTILDISRLKLHKGLIQQYGEDCYYWDRSATPFTEKSYTALTEDQQLIVKKWIKQYSEVLFDPSSLSIIILPENYEKEESLIQAPQGFVIFNNVLEENEKLTPDYSQRHNIDNYESFSFSSAGDLFVPSNYEIVDYKDGVATINWTWTLQNNATDTFGTHIVFHLPGPAMRLILPEHKAYENFISTYAMPAGYSSTVLLAYNVIDKKIIPQIANIDNVSWDGFSFNTMCSKLFTAEDEEFICDEILETSTTNFANYNIPYYTITIENALTETGPKVFLTIV